MEMFISKLLILSGTAKLSIASCEPMKQPFVVRKNYSGQT